LPVIPLFDGLDFSCPSRDCTFSGGDYHILAVAAGTVPGLGVITVPDISELNIEGFTFTGTATEEAGTYSIFLSATYGSGITIKDCTFKNITAPQVDGEAPCFVKGGYVAVYAGFSPEIGDFKAICSVSLSSRLVLFEYWCYDKDEHSSEILSVS
jgi:hypothetical protein